MRKILSIFTIVLVLELLAGILAVVPEQAASSASMLINGATSGTGPVGTYVNVTGNNFEALEVVTVKFDSTTVSTITAGATGTSSAGKWSAYFYIPPAASNLAHTITAIGSASGTLTTSYNVTPKIVASRSTGGVGVTVNVTGSGFAQEESGITLTFDNNSLFSDIMSSSVGSWNKTITVPELNSGEHFINAYGPFTASKSLTPLSFVVTPSFSVSKNSGTPGTIITLTGTGFAARETGISVMLETSPLAANIQANNSGSWSTTFAIPSTHSGVYTITVSGANTTVSSVVAVPIKVLPSITMGKTNGPPGTEVAIIGTGFAVNEIGITVTYDNKPIGTTTQANADGEWNTLFVIPSSPASKHIISAYGALTDVRALTPASFFVAPGISLSKSSGAGGTLVTLYGSGFAANEQGITFTYDGKPAGITTSANAAGDWSMNFSIPSTSVGAHSITARGNSTLASSVPTINFDLVPNIIVSKANGKVGTTVTITGIDFVPNENGIQVSFDQMPILTNVAADATGRWTTNLTIPPASLGSHIIKINGSQTLTTSELPFTISSNLVINPESGYVGTTVNLTGTGFARNSSLRITYDELPLEDVGRVATDDTGSVTKAITVPKSIAGAHTIKVTDSLNNTAEAIFSIQNTIILPPNPVSPADGTRMGITGDATPIFKWQPVEDPNSVTYTFQLDTDPGFYHPFIDQSNLTVTYYIITRAAALERGKYYWRVRAQDSASNITDWSRSSMIESGLMPMWAFISIIVVLALGVISALYFLIIRPLIRRRQNKGPLQTTELIYPEIVSGEYKTLEAGVPDAQRALPYNLSLPEAPETRISHEDQARLEIALNFAKTIPIIEPGQDISWLFEVADSKKSLDIPTLFSQIIKGDIKPRYEPAWLKHPSFQKLQDLLSGNPLLQDLNVYLDSVNQTTVLTITLLQGIYKDASAEIEWDILASGGWQFVSSIYNDSLSWFMGKYLEEPSEGEYVIKPDDNKAGENEFFGLFGNPNTSFGGLLILAEEEEMPKLRELHIKLRNIYRNDERSHEVFNLLAKLKVQRNRLRSGFAKLNEINSKEA